MQTSISLTLDALEHNDYEYELEAGVYFHVRRVDENVKYTDSLSTPVSGYIIFLSVTDTDGNETRTLQPSVIGAEGTCCTVTPVSDPSLLGVPLSDDTLSLVTFEVSYND